ncbi:protein Njmu-R1 isoform X4 [Elephas maximus indicus]|uniref:protein Njmu-R1 isoform X4 n=1 Tax=Elephas maximus indicus TaxID=99487 RepID=UPI0021171419|nr:protein Njmu-R1 isoform X4 [Elephas maximus indicus]
MIRSWKAARRAAPRRSGGPSRRPAATTVSTAIAEADWHSSEGTAMMEVAQVQKLPPVTISVLQVTELVVITAFSNKKNCLLKQQQWTLNISLQKCTFRLELDKYIQGLKNSMNCEERGLENRIKPYLSSWFEDVVCPIQRVVLLFQEKLTFLLHAALSYTPVEVKESDEKTKRDINRFLSVASLQGLIHEGTMTSLCMAMTGEQHKSVVIDCSSSQPQFFNAGSNRFCEDWMQAFLNGAEGGNPFLFRQVLENFKLKAIQDTNNLKRFIRQAEMNHYALFKCYLFLKNCGSGDILLKIVKVEHEEMPEAKNVVAVLEEFMRESRTQSF